jgi:formylglycine-generating enzyme required for sulfatase activity
MATPPSCAQAGLGTSSCNANGESCCAVLTVTGGTYYRTYVNMGAGPVAGSEADQATVSTFALDKYEVTVGRFRAFANAWNGGWRPAAGSGKHVHLNSGQGLVNVFTGNGAYETGWDPSYDPNVVTGDVVRACYSGYGTWTGTAGTQEDLPINCVNWLEAYAFCIYDGGFLPSEAEWIYAAGGSQQLEYPWGSANPGTSNQYAIYGCHYPTGSSMCTGAVSIAPVGTATAGGGPFGQLDMVGNLAQWNLDDYAYFTDPCVDCANLAAPAMVPLGEAYMLYHGGFFYNGTLSSTQDRIGHIDPRTRDDSVGIRCARSL